MFALLFLPAICIAQYAVPTSFGGCGGCPTPICQQRSACPPSPVPFCPPPPPCPPQFCPPPPMCPPPPPPLPCPPPPPPPACPCSPRPYFPPYRPSPYPSYSGGCGGFSPIPRIPAQNDCCCGCTSPCKYRSRRKATAFGTKTVDPSCNNEELRDIIQQNLTDDTTESKRIIQSVAEDRLGSMVNVVCGRGEFSYIAHTDSFCQYSKNDITCYAFRPV